MNGNFDGSSGLYGAVQFGALSELGRLWNEADKGRKGQPGLSWKRVALVLAVMAMPAALLLAGNSGF
jgi:hypothetical protein